MKDFFYRIIISYNGNQSLFMFTRPIRIISVPASKPKIFRIDLAADYFFCMFKILSRMIIHMNIYI